MFDLQDDTQDQFVNSSRACNPLAAYLDAQVRSQEALEQNPEFFDADHLARVEQIVEICNRFFRVKKDIHINHRLNRGDSFSVVKVLQPMFPAVSLARKAAEYRKPIQELGGEFRKVSEGVLIHVR